MEESSSKSEDEIDVYALGEEKIATGKELLAKLDTFKRIDGVAKIQRKISSEIASLQKVGKTILEILDDVWVKSILLSSLAGDFNESIENQPHFVQQFGSFCILGAYSIAYGARARCGLSNQNFRQSQVDDTNRYCCRWRTHMDQSDCTESQSIK